MNNELIQSHQDLKVYQKAFVGAETQTWLDFAVKCQYLDVETGQKLSKIYDEIISILVKVINNPHPWLLKYRGSGGVR